MPKIIFLDENENEEHFISIDDRERTSEQKTVFEMLDQRGYKVIEDDEEDAYLIAKKSFYENVMVFFQKDNGLDTKNLKKIISQSMKKDIKHIIIIYDGKITSAVATTIENGSFEKFDKKDEFDFTNIDIEIFEKSELQFNITKHILQPKSIEKLNIYDKEKLREMTSLKIPCMLKKDPIARFYHFKKGDVIKMIRRDDTIIYRIVK